MAKQRTYFCIDMKSFFASVECSERGLNPFEDNLVVADASRGDGSICLAITPKMKKLGVKNRCRIFEIPKNMTYIVAKPRMKKYIEYAADIYEIYLQYISPEDIHVYSIDECFIDATDYLKCYKIDAFTLVKKLMNEIWEKKGIPATAGIGTNLYLAKIALDITAKKTPEGIGYLDEETYIKTLWNHRPITDFWHVAKGTANRLAKRYIYDMEGVAKSSTDWLYKTFGVNAEILIDHAWGKEPCTMADIKNYKTKSRSISNSQILFEDYSYQDAKVVLDEMVLNACENLISQRLLAKTVTVVIGYSKDVVAPTGKALSMKETTNVYSVVKKYSDKIFNETVDKNHKIRKLSVSLSNLSSDSVEELSLFTDYKKVKKEKDLEVAVLDIKSKFGKNAIVRGIDLTENATAIERNKLIGGHNGE